MTALPLLSNHTDFSFVVVRSFFFFFFVVILNERSAAIRRRHCIPAVVVAIVSVPSSSGTIHRLPLVRVRPVRRPGGLSASPALSGCSSHCPAISTSFRPFWPLFPLSSSTSHVCPVHLQMSGSLALSALLSSGCVSGPSVCVVPSYCVLCLFGRLCLVHSAVSFWRCWLMSGLRLHLHLRLL